MKLCNIKLTSKGKTDLSTIAYTIFVVVYLVSPVMGIFFLVSEKSYPWYLVIISIIAWSSTTLFYLYKIYTEIAQWFYCKED